MLSIAESHDSLENGSQLVPKWQYSPPNQPFRFVG
jgi:hypothetical protein